MAVESRIFVAQQTGTVFPLNMVQGEVLTVKVDVSEWLGSRTATGNITQSNNFTTTTGTAPTLGSFTLTTTTATVTLTAANAFTGKWALILTINPGQASEEIKEVNFAVTVTAP